MVIKTTTNASYIIANKIWGCKVGKNIPLVIVVLLKHQVSISENPLPQRVNKYFSPLIKSP